MTRPTLPQILLPAGTLMLILAAAGWVLGAVGALAGVTGILLGAMLVLAAERQPSRRRR